MAYEVIMPKQGLQMTEGTLVKWLVREGEHVEKGAPLFEMETDKLTITIDAPKSGTLLRILRGEGDTVPIAQVIALIGEPGERADAPPKAALPAASAMTASPAAAPVPAAPGRTGSGPSPGRPMAATPAARALAAEKNVDLTVLDGAGPDGLIIRRDVEAKVRAAEPGAERETPVAFTGMRAAAGPAAAAQASHRAAVDMTALIDLRESLKARDAGVSITDLFVFIVSRALPEYPMMDAALTGEAAGQRRVGVGVGVAVPLPGGLAVPVIRDAHRMPLAQIAAASADLAGRARQGALRPGECGDGAFIIADFGMYGADESIAAVNPPGRGILALGRIRPTPVAAGDGIVVRPVLVMNLSYDPRLADGAAAARFLGRVRQLAENPLLLLL